MNSTEMNMLEKVEACTSPVIVCAGAIRSGSTWQYNIVRLAYKYVNKDITASYLDDWDGDYNPEYPVLLKEHVHYLGLEKKAWKILTSHRINVKKLKESIASFFGPGIGVEQTYKLAYLEQYHKWRMAADYDMEYENFLSYPQSVARNILKVLEFDLSPDDIDIITEQVDTIPLPFLPPCQRDPVTGLHSNHFTDPEIRNKHWGKV